MRFLRFRARGSLVGLQSPGYQLIVARLDEYARLAEELAPARREGTEAILKAARDALESRIWKLVPYPKYDYAWARLHELRHLFCQSLPLERLVGTVIEDMAGDIDYLATEDRRAARDELRTLRQRCLAAVNRDTEEGRHKGRPDGEGEAALRAAAEGLSKRLSLAREGHWLKVNMTRNRIFLMGAALLVLLVVTLLGLPQVLAIEDEAVSPRFYWLVVFFGAIGGLISALMSRESLTTAAAAFYIRRRLLYLRPVVGGTLGLIAYLALRAGVVNFPSLNEEATPLFVLVLAFAAGFSERVFVSRILAVATPGGGADDEGDGADGGKPTKPKSKEPRTEEER